MNFKTLQKIFNKGIEIVYQVKGEYLNQYFYTQEELEEMPLENQLCHDIERDYFFNKIGDKLKKQYISAFGDAYICVSPNHKELQRYFEELCDKYGILYKMSDIINESRKYIKNVQLSLFSG